MASLRHNQLIHVRKFRITVESSLFVGNPCTQIYIPTYVYTCIFLVFIYKIELATYELNNNHEPGNF